MSEPYVGEIRMFAGDFSPRGWAFCDGQLLAISQNDALFSLLGTVYGGDGRTTFGVPDLRGRVPVHAGTGPGLPQRRQGAKFGQESVTLSIAEMPSHSHDVLASNAVGSQAAPGGAMLASSPTVRLYRPTPSNVNFDAAATGSVGGGQSHNNLMPYLCVNFIIALFGVYPSRS